MSGASPVLGVWTDYTPTITGGGGSLTASVVNAAKYILENKRLEIFLDISITTNGTASGGIVSTIPAGITLGTGHWAGCGREHNSTGNVLAVGALNNTLVITTYNNAHPAADGYRLVCHGVGWLT